MVWELSPQGFRFNLIDPHQGQFPFLLEAGAPVETGLAFVATQAGAGSYAQAVALGESRSAATPVVCPPACAVYVDNEAIAAQEGGDVSFAMEDKLRAETESTLAGGVLDGISRVCDARVGAPFGKQGGACFR